MNLHEHQHSNRFGPRTLAFPLFAGLILASAALLPACTSDDHADEPVGYTKTTEKRVIDTPTEKTTITETHEKDTRYSPR